MRVREVDERDSSWEDHRPIFRVYLFRGGEHRPSSWTTWTYDVEDADLIDVAQWAQAKVGDSGLYAVALVRQEAGFSNEGPQKGLVWLIGNDANDEPFAQPHFAARERMTALRDKPIFTIE